MTKCRKGVVSAVLVAALLTAGVACAAAQNNFPSKPIHIIVGNAAVIFQVTQKMFEMRTGTQFQYITHRSNTETMVSLMRGDILMSLSDSGPVSGPLKDGRVRALAVTAAQRMPAWPEVPTMGE